MNSGRQEVIWLVSLVLLLLLRLLLIRSPFPLTAQPPDVQQAFLQNVARRSLVHFVIPLLAVAPALDVPSFLVVCIGTSTPLH